jgi:sensor histidine kinase YesM
MRFSDKFTYTVNIDPALDTDAIRVPNMLVQPQLENAVWHGLRYKKTKGLLSLTIQVVADRLHIVVEDNGIGLKRSKELKTVRQKEHHSRGMTNTYERINLLNDLYHTHIVLNIKDKDGEETGVIVTIEIPLKME